MGVTSTKSGRLEVNLSLSEKRGGKSHFIWEQFYFRRVPGIPGVISSAFNMCETCTPAVPVIATRHPLSNVVKSLKGKQLGATLFTPLVAG
jgi:hypothetical protein